MDNQSDSKTETQKKSMAGIDFISSLVLMAFSLGVILWSFKMPRPGGWPSAPGLLPAFLGVLIFSMSLAMLISSIRNGGPARWVSKWKSLSLKQSAGRLKARRIFWITFFIAIYIFGMLGRMPFEIAGFIYLTLTLYFFWRKGAGWKIILVSILVPLVMGMVFKGIFAVLLPGGSVFDWLRHITPR
jgi:hypothetical protein